MIPEVRAAGSPGPEPSGLGAGGAAFGSRRLNRPPPDAGGEAGGGVAVFTSGESEARGVNLISAREGWGGAGMEGEGGGGSRQPRAGGGGIRDVEIRVGDEARTRREGRGGRAPRAGRAATRGRGGGAEGDERSGGERRRRGERHGGALRECVTTGESDEDDAWHARADLE